MEIRVKNKLVNIFDQFIFNYIGTFKFIRDNIEFESSCFFDIINICLYISEICNVIMYLILCCELQLI